MKITFISDTHTLHDQLTQDLPGGDLLIHSGDLMSSGYSVEELINFCEWFDSIPNYKCKIFIAGNHDRIFQIDPIFSKEIYTKYKSIIYLQDESYTFEGVKIYGSPWQPEFYNWAFNLQRNGVDLEEKWSWIPNNTDILITHGPVHGYVDTVKGRTDHLGCEKLRERINVIKTKIHCCGHIHSGYGYSYNESTHFLNASVLNERYDYQNAPMTVEWNKEINGLIFV